MVAVLHVAAELGLKIQACCKRKAEYARLFARLLVVEVEEEEEWKREACGWRYC